MFRPKAPYLDTLTRLGLTNGLKLCLDAGDAASYTSGQKWLDRSGGGYDFFFGVDGSTASDDPTFNGSAGGLSTAEYFSFDGGDYFTYDTANETWMQNLHKAGAKLTIMAWVWFGSAASSCVFGNDANTAANVGVNFRKSGAGACAFTVRHASGGATSALDQQNGTVPTGQWTFMAVSLDETVGASGGFQVVDGSVIATFNSAYTSPSAANATFTSQIGAPGNTATAVLPNGSRLAFFAIWEGVALTSAQVQSIYQATDTLVANFGSFAFTGVADSLRTTAAVAAASFTLDGIAAPLTPTAVAVTASYAVAGIATAFSLNAAMMDAGAYVLTGNVAVLTPSTAAGAGSYNLAGQNASFTVSLAPAAGAYSLSGQAALFPTSFTAAAGVYTLNGNRADLSYDIDRGGIGGRITGGSFSRRRWRELQDEQRRARDAARREVERIEQEARDAARKAAAEQRAEIAAARRAEDEANAQAARLRALTGAARATAGAQAITGAINDAIAMTAMARQGQAAKLAKDDEDEAIALLLLAA